MKVAFIIAVSVLLTLAPGIAANPSPDVHAIAQAVDDRYNHLRTLQAEFVETYEGAGIERSESGSLWLKKPGKMRWEYRTPREKLFLSDGKDAWFYTPGDRQVRRTSVKKLDDLRSPLGFLLGKTRLEKELDALAMAPDVAPLPRAIPSCAGYRGLWRIGSIKLSSKLRPTFTLHASNLKRRMNP